MDTDYLAQLNSITNGKFSLIPKLLIQAIGGTKYKSKQSIFFNSDVGKWMDVYSYFYYPLKFDSFEDAFLSSINSEKDINSQYCEVRNMKIVKAFYVNEKGYSKEEIK